MGIKINVKWKFKVNGKEYGSVDEMPSDVRGAYEKAKGTFGITTSKIVFNGQEYQGLERMPHDIRQVYEKVMRAAGTGEITADVISGAEHGTTTRSQCSIGVARSPNAPRPIEPESTFSLSPRMLIVGLALLILLMGLYLVIAR